MAILTLCGAGDHIVSASTLYGGTFNQFNYTFPRLGIDVTFVDPGDPENFRKAIRPNTKILYGETLGNPRINVFPFEEVAAIGKEVGLDFLLFSDHMTLQAYHEGREGFYNGILILIGYEHNDHDDCNHYLLFDIDEVLPATMTAAGSGRRAAAARAPPPGPR